MSITATDSACCSDRRIKSTVFVLSTSLGPVFVKCTYILSTIPLVYAFKHTKTGTRMSCLPSRKHRHRLDLMFITPSPYRDVRTHKLRCNNKQRFSSFVIRRPLNIPGIIIIIVSYRQPFKTPPNKKKPSTPEALAELGKRKKKRREHCWPHS